jgi:hypothetical protein
MKHLTWILCLAFVCALAGCNFKQKMEEQAEEAMKAAEEEAAKAVEEAAGEEAEEEEAEAEEAEEEAEEEAADMAVDKEEIDKAVEIYKVMHDEDLTAEAKDRKFKEMLEENEWDKEDFEGLIYEITQDPASRAYYNENIEE